MKRLSPKLKQARKLAEFYRDEFLSSYLSEFGTSLRMEVNFKKQHKLPWEKPLKK